MNTATSNYPRLTDWIREAAIFALMLATVLALPTQAATITIVVADGAGEGFNDPTPAAPEGGNNGATIGQQRLNVFEAAATQWGRYLISNVAIRVNAQFNPLTCNGSSAVLGSAGAATITRNFANAPFTGTWYSIALASALAGTDQSGGDDINARFNVDIDNGTCLTGNVWWYGTDPNIAVPANQVALLPVVFHELAHGLGFQTFTNSATGVFAGTAPNTFPSIWDRFLFDRDANQSWQAMGNTPAGDSARIASAINNPDLTWNGPNVTAAFPSRLTVAGGRINITAPAAIAGLDVAGTATFGPALTSTGITGSVVLAVDAMAPFNDGCEAIANGAALSGNIALVDRGGPCSFTIRVLNAQVAGAIAVIVADNVAHTLSGMTGTNPSITIPSLRIELDTGNNIKAQLPSPGVTLTMSAGTNSPLGSNSGSMRMYSPDPLEPGSSVSHFSTDASPDLLMEPALNENNFDEVDLTIPLFRDIGWSLDLIFADGFQ